MKDVLAGIVGEPVVVSELEVKAGRRTTSLATGPRGAAVVKTYASDRAPTVAARVVALADGPDEPAVPPLLHLDEDAHTVVLGMVPGVPLRLALLEGDLTPIARAGAAIGGWHRAWSGASPDGLRPHTAERELAAFARVLERFRPAGAERLERAATELAQPWEASTVVHRDLYEDQIVVDDRIGLIDLDDAALGPPELDLGNLIAHVELLERRTGRDLDEELRAFRLAYAAAGPPIDGDRLDRCRRLTLLRLSVIHADPELAPPAVHS